jgi:hypothetical protein
LFKSKICHTVFAAVLAGLLALGGCGGGGGSDSASASSTAPVSVSAGDDTIAVPWNALSSLDVTSNDTTSAGTLAVASVGTPAHGQAAIDGNKIAYTPATGYFGPDAVTYTVSSGGASATATVHLDVKASVAISGTVSDGPIANATVQVTMGTQTQSVQADAQGRYSVTLESDDPAAFVTVDAGGAGGQSFVKLRSLVGSFGTLAGASSQGKLDSAQQRSLDVTHISTALAVLAAQANGGSPPASDTQMATAVSRIDPGAWEDMAAVIKTVIDGNASLPAGEADTLALVSDASAYASFLKTFDLQQNADAFHATRSGVVQAMAAGVPVLLTAGADQTAVIYAAPLSDGTAYLVEGTAAGQVTVTSSYARLPATLSRAADRLTLTFASPIEHYESYGDVVDPGTGQTVSADFWVNTMALTLQQAAGASGALVLTRTTTRTYIDGPFEGQTVPDPAPPPTYVVQAMDYAKRLPVQASEFTAGSRWAGFLPASSQLSTNMSLGLQAAFDLSGANAAHALYDGGTYELGVSDDVLTITGGGTQRDYVRLATGVTGGTESWLAIQRDANGTPTGVLYVAVVHAAGPFNWSVADAAHVWQLYETADVSLAYRLNADAGQSAEWDYWTLGTSSVTTQMLTWQFGTDESISIYAPVGGTPPLETQVHNWVPLVRVGSFVCMLQTESFVDNQTQAPSIYYRRVGCIADQGPPNP